MAFNGSSDDSGGGSCWTGGAFVVSGGGVGDGVEEDFVVGSRLGSGIIGGGGFGGGNVGLVNDCEDFAFGSSLRGGFFAGGGVGLSVDGGIGGEVRFDLGGGGVINRFCCGLDVPVT